MTNSEKMLLSCIGCTVIIDIKMKTLHRPLLFLSLLNHSRAFLKLLSSLSILLLYLMFNSNALPKDKKMSFINDSRAERAIFYYALSKGGNNFKACMRESKKDSEIFECCRGFYEELGLT